jgi:hypothetical protein
VWVCWPTGRYADRLLVAVRVLDEGYLAGCVAICGFPVGDGGCTMSMRFGAHDRAMESVSRILDSVAGEQTTPRWVVSGVRGRARMIDSDDTLSLIAKRWVVGPPKDQRQRRAYAPTLSSEIMRIGFVAATLDLASMRDEHGGLHIASPQGSMVHRILLGFGIVSRLSLDVIHVTARWTKRLDNLLNSVAT